MSPHCGASVEELPVAVAFDAAGARAACRYPAGVLAHGSFLLRRWLRWPRSTRSRAASFRPACKKNVARPDA